MRYKHIYDKFYSSENVMHVCRPYRLKIVDQLKFQ